MVSLPCLQSPRLWRTAPLHDDPAAHTLPSRWKKRSARRAPRLARKYHRSGGSFAVLHKIYPILDRAPSEQAINGFQMPELRLAACHKKQ
jgi:hypothetical protein